MVIPKQRRFPFPYSRHMLVVLGIVMVLATSACGANIAPVDTESSQPTADSVPTRGEQANSPSPQRTITPPNDSIHQGVISPTSPTAPADTSMPPNDSIHQGVIPSPSPTMPADTSMPPNDAIHGGSAMRSSPTTSSSSAPNGTPTSPESAEERPTYATKNLSVVWSFAAGSMVHDSPRLVGDTLYLTARDQGVFALDAATGTERWQVPFTNGVWDRSLAVGKERLFVGAPGEELIALDQQSGQELWRLSVQGEVQRAPLVIDDTLYVGTTYVGADMESDPEQHAWVYAIARDSGEIIWSYETENYLVVTPAWFDGMLFIGGSYYNPSQKVTEGGHMRISALNATTGELLWSTTGESGLIKHMHAHEQTLYYLAYEDKLFALDTATGEERWTYHTENWTPDFLFANGTIYFGVGNGFVHAVDGFSGEQLWKTRLDIFRRPLEAPQLQDRLLYLQVAQQQIFVLDAESGEVQWVAEHPIPTREEVIVGDGIAYVVDVSDDGMVYAMEWE